MSADQQTPQPGGPWTLAIEASNPSAADASGEDAASGPGVAVGTSDADGGPLVLGSERLSPTGRHDDDLMPAIDRLCARLGRSPAGLGRVIVSIGPGGFTGIRVAIATAKALAITTGVEVTGVPTARVAAEVMPEDRFPCAVLLASTRNGPEPTAWAEVFVRRGAPSHAGVVGAGDLVALRETLGVRTIVADGQLPGELRPAGVEVLPLRLSAAACLRAGWSMPAIDAGGLSPLYGREPEAVRRWRELHGTAPGD